ncbi:MAG: hypothetical protein LBF79_00125 [Dysgonamonadaceae bacterium]|nr:hypothetical protein [Dysgonamonadaceae bacterium]
MRRRRRMKRRRAFTIFCA